MKETSELLAEAVGRPGNEDLAPVLAEVQWLERANATMLNVILSGRAALQAIQDDMKASYSPERLAEVQQAADALKERRAKGVFGTGLTNDQAMDVAINGTDEEVSALLDKVLDGLAKPGGVGTEV